MLISLLSCYNYVQRSNCQRNKIAHICNIFLYPILFDTKSRGAMVLSVYLYLAKDLTSNTVASRLFVYGGVYAV